MEYVDSRSLHDTLASDGPFNPVRAAEIGLGVLAVEPSSAKAAYDCSDEEGSAKAETDAAVR
jgi:hypothetical protein